MTEKSDCPSSELWAKLLDDDVAGLDLTMLEAHLDECESCSRALTEMAGDWMLADDSIRQNDPLLGRTSFAMLGRVAAASRMANPGPSPVEGPVVPPEIPGLVDWEVVGRGGMGVVFRAREVELDRPVAVKVLSSGGQSSPSAKARAIREAMLMASLRHPNVVPVHRSGETQGVPFLIMEWVGGGTLRARIEGGFLSIRESAETARDLARAIAEAHALGIIHRDLKPENVLLAPSGVPGSRPVPKLTDFGLARRGDGDGVTETGAVLGTPGYMAPEQTGLVRGGAEVGPATDIHGLGAILHACLTGRAPYAGRSSWEMLARAAHGSPPSVREARPDVPRDLSTIVDKCLAASPSRRYRSAGELADDLDRYLEGRPITARPISAPERWLKWSRRHPALAASAALLVLSSIAGVAGIAYHVASMDRSLRDLAEEQTRTREALVSATSSRDQARRALGSLTDEVVERMLRRGSALNEADRSFLAKVRGYYAEWPLDPDPQSALKFRGMGLDSLAILFEKIGQYDDAQSCREAAIREYDESLGRGFASKEVVARRLDSMGSLHAILGRTGKHVEAEALIRKLIEAREPLTHHDKGQALFLVWDYVMLASDLAAQGRVVEAETPFRTAIERVESLRSAHPDDLAIRNVELMTHYNRSYAFHATGRKSQAELGFRKVLALADEAWIVFPGTLDLLQHYSLASEVLAHILEEERPEEALVIHSRAMRKYRALIDQYPGNKALQVALLRGAAFTYRISWKLGRPAEAEPDLAAAIKEGERLVEAEPAVFELARDLAFSLEHYAALFERTNRPLQAIENYDRAATVLGPWVKLSGKSADVIPFLVAVRGRTAELLSSHGDHARAAQTLTSMIDMVPPEDRAKVHLAIARELLASGDKPGARLSVEQARPHPDAAKMLETINASPELR